jgi:adenylate cyclase
MKYLALVLMLLSLLSAKVFEAQFPETLKLKTFDYLVETPDESGYFAILNITEADVDKEGGYPLPRARLAEIQNKLIAQGAIGVGWVIGFPHSDRTGGDADFAGAMSYSRTVLPLFEYDNADYPPPTGTVIIGDDVGGYLARGTLQSIPELAATPHTTQGIATAPVDIDNLVRRLPLLYRTPDGWLPAYATQVLKVLAESDTYIIKTNENGLQEVIVQGLPPIKVDSLGRKWVSWIVSRETSLDQMDVEGRFVFVGVTAAGVMPQLATPIGLLEPHYIQAALAESLLVENSPYIPDYALAVECLVIVLTVFLVWLAISLCGLTLGIMLAVGVMIATGVTGVLLVKDYGILIDATWPLIAQFISGALAFYLRFREQFKLRQQIKGQFGTYLSPDMVDMLVKDPSLMKLGGDRRDMTFLFADIVGFTPISEAYMRKDDPEGLVELINLFLDKMTKIILKNGGTIDKYMGDCVMAFWNAPLPCENHAALAVQSAMEIELMTEHLNRELKESGVQLPPVVIGTGINTGTCIVGNMGSESRFDYSVVGDAVNLAARLEVQTRDFDTPIILSEFTHDLVKDSIACEYLAGVNVKGKEQEVSIYAPHINAFHQLSPSQSSFIAPQGAKKMVRKLKK